MPAIIIFLYFQLFFENIKLNQFPPLYSIKHQWVVCKSYSSVSQTPQPVKILCIKNHMPCHKFLARHFMYLSHCLREQIIHFLSSDVHHDNPIILSKSIEYIKSKVISIFLPKCVKIWCINFIYFLKGLIDSALNYLSFHVHIGHVSYILRRAKNHCFGQNVKFQSPRASPDNHLFQLKFLEAIQDL